MMAGMAETGATEGTTVTRAAAMTEDLTGMTIVTSS
jgi:hypothetical protein